MSDNDVFPPTPSAIDRRADTLVIELGIPFNDWRRYGEKLLEVEGSVQWFLGDWWVFGQEVFGMDYHPALEEFSVAHPTLLEYARVARAFPPRREKAIVYRISEVSWAHHRVLASVKDEQERMAWLEDSIRQNWSTRELLAVLQEHAASERRSPPALSFRLVEDYYRLAMTAAERRKMDPREWVLEAIREKSAREATGELEAVA